MNLGFLSGVSDGGNCLCIFSEASLEALTVWPAQTMKGDHPFHSRSLCLVSVRPESQPQLEWKRWWVSIQKALRFF